MVAPDNLVESSMDKADKEGDTDNQPSPIANGNEVQPSDDQVASKNVSDESRQPSYVALACCISGYTTLHYDSKQRQGLRSPRPLSPSRPPTVANNGNQNLVYKSECGNYLSPVRHELKNKMPIEGKGVEVLNGHQSLSSPRHIQSITSESRRNFTSSMISDNYSFSSSSHYTSFSNTSNLHSPAKPEYVNGSRLIAATKAPTQVSPSSFIVQRVERLYGPGALAQGFYTPRRISSVSKTPSTKEIRGGIGDNTGSGTVDDSLPVLKLLRPEFRAQLTVTPRKSKSPESKLITLNTTNGTSGSSKPRDVIDATLIERTKEINLNEVKDGHYYLKILDEKVADLEKLAQKADDELVNCDNEEGAGILRSISGKARLLIAEKLNQFRGLCHKNLKQSDDEDFPTTNEDLAGFWDMVLIQITAVLSQVDEIEEMKNNNWQPSTPKPKVDSNPRGTTVAGRKLAPRKANATPKVSAASKARDEARRKMIEERRKAMKEVTKHEDDTAAK